MDRGMKIISYNVKGLTNPIKRAKILTKMKRENGQILFLQETHLANEEHLKLQRQGFNRVYCASCETGRKRGMAILISRRVVFEKMTVRDDKEGRYMMVVGKLNGVSKLHSSMYIHLRVQIGHSINMLLI